MSKSLITVLNRSSRTVAAIAYVVTLTFVMMILAPTVAAAQEAADEAANEALIAGSEERQLSNAVAKVKRTLEKLQGKIDRNEDGTLEKNELKQLDNSIRQLDQTVSQRFDQIAEHIQNKNLDPVIEQRHSDMVSNYRSEFDALVAYLAELESNDAAVVSQAVDDALNQLNQFMLERPHQPVVPGQFSNFSVEPDFDNQPMESATDFTRAGYFDNPYVQLAAVGDFSYDMLPGADDPAYLAETDEVRISDAIRAKAEELENDPVKIYYWVRNNIEWLPTWGAIQDSDITLGSQRGNAMDIASLLIAMYRASGIPARYVHGAIEVPQDQFDNWTGNFTDSQAALTFASSGGIPLRQHTLTDGETSTTTVRMEHIWVEAALDYFPSRAAINKDADSWVKLDASFKQYEDLEGLEPFSVSGIEPAAVAQQFVDSGTMNESEGWIQGFDQSVLLSAQSQVQQSLEDYIAANLSDPLGRNVLGGRKTIIQEYPTVPAVFSASVIATGPKYGSIPNALQPKITFAFDTDILGEPINPITFPWSRLNNRKVTLSFKPATVADEEALDSLVPPDANDSDDLPQSIPSYLLQVVPELKLEGETVKVGDPMRLGEELLFYNRIDEPNGSRFSDQRSIIVGSYVAFAVIGGSVSTINLEQLEDTVSNTQNRVGSDDPVIAASVDREELIGDLVYSGILGYFAQYASISSLVLGTNSGEFGLPLSAGVYAFEPNVSYFFGIPRSVEVGGMSMDLHRVSRNFSADNLDGEERFFLGFQLGALSSTLEHMVPEQMLNDETESAEAISAAKAVSIAMAEGQKIFNIGVENKNEVMTQLDLSADVKSEILAYIQAGYRAIAPSSDVTVDGWRGAGYVLYDPVSGSSSWKISGGSNGSYYQLFDTLLKIFQTVFLNSAGELAFPTYLGRLLAFLGYAKLAANFFILLEECNALVAGLVSGLMWWFGKAWTALGLAFAFSALVPTLLLGIAFMVIVAFAVNLIMKAVTEITLAACRALDD